MSKHQKTHSEATAWCIIYLKADGTIGGAVAADHASNADPGA
jgi:hypothetical protein